MLFCESSICRTIIKIIVTIVTLINKTQKSDDTYFNTVKAFCPDHVAKAVLRLSLSTNARRIEKAKVEKEMYTEYIVVKTSLFFPKAFFANKPQIILDTTEAATLTMKSVIITSPSLLCQDCM